jgi:hypothetical protein
MKSLVLIAEPNPDILWTGLFMKESFIRSGDGTGVTVGDAGIIICAITVAFGLSERFPEVLIDLPELAVPFITGAANKEGITPADMISRATMTPTIRG